MKTRHIDTLGRKLKPPKSLADEVTRILRTEINKGRFKPGQRLPTEAALAESLSFGISRTIVRKALARLRYDGLLEIRPGQGATIIPYWERTRLPWPPGGEAPAACRRSKNDCNKWKRPQNKTKTASCLTLSSTTASPKPRATSTSSS